MFPVFHLAWSTCRATKTFVAGWRKLLRKVERGSTLSNKFWLCCSFFKLTTCRATNLLVPLQINQSAHRISSTAQMFLLWIFVDQVDHARWKTRNIDQNLRRNNVARQVEGFCISYFAAVIRNTKHPSYFYLGITPEGYFVHSVSCVFYRLVPGCDLKQNYNNVSTIGHNSEWFEPRSISS